MIIMDIINKYFEFKKTSLMDYSLVFLNSKSANKYLLEFINTYINTYYFHILDTYYEKLVYEYDDKVIIKEIKAKRLELLEETNKIEDEKERNKEQSLINECYKYSFLSIIIDLNNFTYCNKLSEFRDALKIILIDNQHLIEDDEEIIEKLSVLLKDNTNKERKFFVGLRNDTFTVNYYSYRYSNENYLVKLHYNIQQLENNYTKLVLEKNYNNEKISLDKLIATANLVEIDLLNKMMRNKPIKHYFIECPLSQIEKREDFENIVKSFSNPRIKDNVVFIINYNDYTSNKTLFKNLSDYNFALLIDLSRTIVIEKRLAEIESYDIFRYVIINGMKKEDHQLVENYVMKNKEMFMNELNMM